VLVPSSTIAFVYPVRFFSYSFCIKDEYSRLSRNASVGVDGYVLVFSIISRQSFDRIKQINESLLSALGDAVDIPRVLVGSICDLNDQRQVPYRVSSHGKCLSRHLVVGLFFTPYHA